VQNYGIKLANQVLPESIVSEAVEIAQDLESRQTARQAGPQGRQEQVARIEQRYLRELVQLHRHANMSIDVLKEHVEGLRGEMRREVTQVSAETARCDEPDEPDEPGETEDEANA
jgi:hypothetical protein